MLNTYWLYNFNLTNTIYFLNTESFFNTLHNIRKKSAITFSFYLLKQVNLRHSAIWSWIVQGCSIVLQGLLTLAHLWVHTTFRVAISNFMHFIFRQWNEAWDKLCLKIIILCCWKYTLCVDNSLLSTYRMFPENY